MVHYRDSKDRSARLKNMIHFSRGKFRYVALAYFVRGAAHLYFVRS